MPDRCILLDTGPLVALFTATDSHHHRCVDTFASLTPPLLTRWPVLTEAAWLLRKQHQPLARIAAAPAAGMFDLLPLDGDSLTDIAAIMRRYEDSGLQLADAAPAHLVDRENIRTLSTLDRRDFSIIRLRRNRALRLIPDIP